MTYNPYIHRKFILDLDELELLTPDELSNILRSQFLIAKVNLEYVRRLLKAGADQNIDDESSWRPIHRASFKGNCKAVSLLLEYDNRLDYCDAYGRTPLHLAILERHDKLSKILIRAGAPLESRDNNGCTPLYYAVRKYNTIGVIKELLLAGASLEAKDNKGYTALYHCTDEMYRRIDKIRRSIKSCP